MNRQRIEKLSKADLTVKISAEIAQRDRHLELFTQKLYREMMYFPDFDQVALRNEAILTDFFQATDTLKTLALQFATQLAVRRQDSQLNTSFHLGAVCCRARIDDGCRAAYADGYPVFRRTMKYRLHQNVVTDNEQHVAQKVSIHLFIFSIRVL